MKTILIVDDMAIFRDPIAAALKMEGFATLCAASGAEALHLMKIAPPDLVLLDVAMPQMDGLTLLKAVRQDPAMARVPVILLTAVSDRQYILEAAKLGVRDYLLKSRFSLAELLERVRRSLGSDGPANPTGAASPAAPASPAARAPAAPPGKPSAVPVAWRPTVASTEVDRTIAIPRLLTREKCTEKVQDLLQARTLSGAVAQVIAMAASPRTDLSELATLVGRDAMLSAKVLKAANSAAYASNRGIITTVADAVRNVGCSTVRNVAASCAIYEAMPETSPDGFNPIRCWQHSFAVATLCSSLAAKVDESVGGVAYLIGLCHDLGQIVFHTHFGPEYRQLLELQSRTGRRRDELERIMLGMTHNELVSTILRCIGLPDSIRGPIESFRGGGAGRTDPHQAMARLLRIANTCANGMLLASSEMSQVAPLARSELQAAVGMESPPAEGPDGLRNQILCITGMLAQLSRDDETRLMTPLFPRRDLRVWLAREGHLSAYDPVAGALSAMAQVEVHDSLPAPGQLNEYQALVVLARSPASAGMADSDLRRLFDAQGPVPLLWLTGRTEGACDAKFRPVSWPISLCHLDQFLRQASTQPQRQAA